MVILDVEALTDQIGLRGEVVVFSRIVMVLPIPKRRWSESCELELLEKFERVVPLSQRQPRIDLEGSVVQLSVANQIGGLRIATCSWRRGKEEEEVNVNNDFGQEMKGSY